MDLGTIVGVVFPILTIIVGGACVLLFSITTTLRASNSDLRARVADLESMEVRNEATISSQAAEIAVWAKAVTGEAYLVALTDMLENHHREAVISSARIEKGVDSVLDELRKAP